MRKLVIIDCCDECGAYDHDGKKCTVASADLIFVCPLQDEETDEHEPSYLGGVSHENKNHTQ